MSEPEGGRSAEKGMCFGHDVHGYHHNKLTDCDPTKDLYKTMVVEMPGKGSGSSLGYILY